MEVNDKHILSKSTYLRGKQCYKSLYLYKKHYNLKDPVTPELQAIFDRGNNVGVLAQDLFPGGVDASPSSVFKYRESVNLTDQLIKEGKEIIYEAAFQYDQVMVALDILVKKAGKWYGYEVKSSTAISEVYLKDISLQHYVITSAGLELEDISIIYVDKEYVRQDNLDIHQFFKTQSLIKKAKQNQNEINTNIDRLKQVIYETAIPEVAIGEHCDSPYSCDFKGYCWKDIPENSVFDISGMSKVKQFELYNKGIHSIHEIPDNYPLTANQRIQVNAEKNGKSAIKKDEIRSFLNEMSYPILFMDFETFMPVVPLFKGTKPNEQIPFQYSIHSIASISGEVSHEEFLAEPGSDPRRAFTENLLKQTKGIGTVLVYNEAFEKRILRLMQNAFPDLKDAIEELIDRIKDLIIPFKQKWYYHPKMRGSYSIKYVLPALIPELNYDNLDIQNGHMASSIYSNLQTEVDLFKIAELKEGLKRYCELDTLAMVELFKVLDKVVKE